VLHNDRSPSAVRRVTAWEAGVLWACGYDGEARNAYRIFVCVSFFGHTYLETKKEIGG
jgi:hypothetical protein